MGKKITNNHANLLSNKDAYKLIMQSNKERNEKNKIKQQDNNKNNIENQKPDIEEKQENKEAEKADEKNSPEVLEKSNVEKKTKKSDKSKPGKLVRTTIMLHENYMSLFGEYWDDEGTNMSHGIRTLMKNFLKSKDLI